MSKIRNFYSLMQRSIKGEHHDYTKGDISEAVILLAIPMILEIALESVFAIVDMFFVSKLGQNAVATVGFTESVITIVYSLAIGLSVGATAVVARRIGEKNPEAAAHAGAQSLVMAAVLSTVFAIPAAYFAADILTLMGASAEVVAEGTTFAQIMLGGNLVIFLLFLINGIFRGAGDAAMAMRSLWIASGVNIILCPIMIHFFGLKGAAIATLIGRSSGVIYQCYHLFKGNGVIKLTRQHFKFDYEVVKSITGIASPASLQFIIGSGSWIFLTRLVAETGGTSASAAYQIAFRNFMFFILPAWGLSNAAATMVGQNLGAKDFDRAEQSVIITAKYSAIMMAFVSLIFIFFSSAIMQVFTDDTVVFNYGVTFLKVIGSGFIFYGVAMVMMQALNGAGDTKTSSWINFYCFWAFQTPAAYLLAHYFDMKSLGVVIVIPIAQAVMTAVAWYYFKKGHWKKIQV